MAGGFKKHPILTVANGKDPKLETINPNAMHRPLFIAPLLASHEKIPRPNRRTLRFGKLRRWRF